MWVLQEVTLLIAVFFLTMTPLIAIMPLCAHTPHSVLLSPRRKAMSAFLWLSYLIRSQAGFPGLVQAPLEKELAACHCFSVPG